MSVSRIRDSDADRFSTATLRLLMVWSKRFWYAPSDARCEDTDLIALSTSVMAACGSVVRFAVAVPSEFALTPLIEMSSFSFAFAPTWNDPLLPATDALDAAAVLRPRSVRALVP